MNENESHVLIWKYAMTTMVIGCVVTGITTTAHAWINAKVDIERAHCEAEVAKAHSHIPTFTYDPGWRISP